MWSRSEHSHRRVETQDLVDERAHVLHLPHVLVCRARTRTDDVEDLLPEPRENVGMLGERKDGKGERAGRRVAAGEEDVERLVLDYLVICTGLSGVQCFSRESPTISELAEMLQERLVVPDLVPGRLLDVRSHALERDLPLLLVAQRLLDHRVDELVHRRQVLLHLVAKHLRERPRLQEPAADRRRLERVLERAHEPVRGVHGRVLLRLRRRVRGRVRDGRRERADVLAEEELGRAVHGKARHDVLPVDGYALAEAFGGLVESVLRVPERVSEEQEREARRRRTGRRCRSGRYGPC